MSDAIPLPSPFASQPRTRAPPHTRVQAMGVKKLPRAPLTVRAFAHERASDSRGA